MVSTPCSTATRGFSDGRASGSSGRTAVRSDEPRPAVPFASTASCSAWPKASLFSRVETMDVTYGRRRRGHALCCGLGKALKGGASLETRKGSRLRDHRRRSIVVLDDRRDHGGGLM